MRKILLVAITALCLFTFSKISRAQGHMPAGKPFNLNLSAEQWREDLRVFAAELPKRHKNAFHSMKREDFENAVKELDREIPNLKSAEVFVRFLKLIAMVGDGHTSIQESALFGLGFYPLRYHVYPEGVFVQSASAEYADLVGGKVVKIGDFPIEKVVSQLKEISWGDKGNEQSKKVETAFLLSIPKVLQGLKIADGEEKVNVTVENNGQQKTIEIKPLKDLMNYLNNAEILDANHNAKNPKPLYLKDQQNLFWYEYLKESKIMYVQFNEVMNKNDESIETFFKRVFEFTDNNAVEKFILDVRFNTGGNNLLNKPIVIGLIRSKLNERGKLFVITGRKTFSAAQNLVNELEKYTNAIFVGEPTGSSPNLYGDPVIMMLPNSKMPFRVSTLFHQNNPTDRRVWTAPEIFAETTAVDYRNNVDPAFQAIVEYVPGRTFKDLTAKTLNNKNISLFIKKYREFRSDPSNKFVNTETEMNTLGYELLRAQRITDAITVFKLNVENYPNSANVYDSLAEAYLTAGNHAEAIKNYEMALKINPNFQSSINALQKLKK